MIIRDGRYGKKNRVEVRIEDTPGFVQFAVENQITEITVRPCITDISFLTEIPHLNVVHLRCFRGDVAPIYALPELRYLTLHLQDNQEVDFTKIPSLEGALVYFQSRMVSIFDAPNIKKLRIELLPSKFAPRISRLTNLEELSLFSLAVSDLDFLRPLSKMKELRLVRMRKLTDVKSIAYLKNLEYLWVQNASGFTDLSFLEELCQIRWIKLEGVGPVDSIMPLRKLENLRQFCLYNPNVAVMDGETSFLRELPEMQMFSIEKSPKVRWTSSEFDEKLRSRDPEKEFRA